LGAVLYISGIYTSFFGQATLVVPIVLGVYAALFVGVIVYDRMSWTRIVIDEGLTVLDERLMTLLKRHVEAEKRSKKLLESMIDEVEYAPIKLLLLNIMLDTEKHEKLARNIVRTLSGEVKVPSREGYRRQVEAARGGVPSPRGNRGGDGQAGGGGGAHGKEPCRAVPPGRRPRRRAGAPQSVQFSPGENDLVEAPGSGPSDGGPRRFAIIWGRGPAGGPRPSRPS